jgi:trigger factor
MQVSVESGEGLERRMTVELPAEQVDEKVVARLKQIAKTTKMDGFRPGKVPLSEVRKRYQEQVRQEVFGELVQSSYFEAISSEKLQPAGYPSIEPVERDPEQGMAYTAIFEVMPEISLNDLSGITIERPVVEVKDADLEEMIERLRGQRVTWNEVERAAKTGDQTTINFKGFIEGEAFDGGSANGVALVLGSKSMIDGFEDGLVGASAGDNRTLELKFPDEYQVDTLAGKMATFEVEITAVAEPVLPEVDAEFVQAFGVASGDIDEFRKEIRANLERERDDKVRNVLKKQVMDALLEVNPVEVPESMVKQESEAMLEQTKANMAQSGHDSSKLDLPASLFEDQARRRVSLGLIVSELVKDKEIKLDEERVRARVEEVAQGYDDPQEVIDYYYSNEQQLAGVQNIVIEEQVVDWVVEQAKVEEQEMALDALVNPSEDES